MLACLPAILPGENGRSGEHELDELDERPARRCLITDDCLSERDNLAALGGCSPLADDEWLLIEPLGVPLSETPCKLRAGVAGASSALQSGLVWRCVAEEPDESDGGVAIR